MKAADQNRIKTLLQNNPMGAAATLSKRQEAEAKNEFKAQDNAEKRLNESIKNAHKLRMESAQNPEIAAKKTITHSSQVQRGLNDQVDVVQAPPRMGGSPLLEEEDDVDYMELGELKVKHDRLVDKILEEEDTLISNHHR
jgi:hypothetical protein